MGFPADVIARIFPRPKPEILVRGQARFLDGLRGLAILLIVLSTFSAGVKTVAPTMSLGLLREGRHGMDALLVLSGFLITGVLLDAARTPKHMLNCYARRALRIGPLYYIVLIGVFVVLPALSLVDATWAQLAGRQAPLWGMYSNFVTALGGSGDDQTTKTIFHSASIDLNHLWAVALVAQLSVAWPVVVWLTPRKALVWVCLLAIAGGVVCRLVMAIEHQSEATLELMLATFTPCRLDAWGVGALIAVAARDERWMAKLTLVARAAGFVSIAGLAVTLVFLSRLPVPLYTLKGLFLAGLFGSIVVMGLSLEITPATRFFSNMALVLLGKVSYGVYIWHVLLSKEFSRFFGPDVLAARLDLPPLVAGLFFVVLAILASIAVATVSWGIVEWPFLWLKRFFEMAPPAPETNGDGPVVVRSAA